MKSLSYKRLGTICAGLISAAVSICGALLFPAVIVAQCNFGNCNIPPGYCVAQQGWCQDNEVYLEYYDDDCDSGRSLCEHDICWFFDRLNDNSCPIGQSGAVCYNSDYFWCNGQGCGGTGASCSDDTQCCTGSCGRETGTCGGGGSPILINVRSNTTNDHLTSATDGVFFDLAATGQPERIAWTLPDAPVGFLALDRNGNGAIDDGRELFGNFTRKSDGSLAANGFDALTEFDVNRDGVLDGRDPVFGQLRLWFDRNHNGRSEPDELVSLATAGVNAILTAYTESDRTDKFGNRYKFVGTAVLSQQRLRRIFDVFLIGL